MSPIAGTTPGGPGEWRTPPELFAALHRRYQFDLDAFATRENHLLEEYCADWGEHSGLTVSWRDRRVFMNPPYTRDLIGKCMAKAASERNAAAIIVALIPAATSTRWWHESVLPYCELIWLTKRVKYLRPDGTPAGSPSFDSIVAVYRSEIEW